jgi:hypothetical protein
MCIIFFIVNSVCDFHVLAHYNNGVCFMVMLFELHMYTLIMDFYIGITHAHTHNGPFRELEIFE